jgi:hypothetical protein
LINKPDRGVGQIVINNDESTFSGMIEGNFHYILRCIGIGTHNLNMLCFVGGPLRLFQVCQWPSFIGRLILGLLMSCILGASICVAHQLISGLRSFHEFQNSTNRRFLISEVLAGTSAEHGHPFSFGSRPKLPTVLFGMQSFLSAIIMLILMTFNGYLILSCVLGSAFGYYWFYKGHDVECH